MQATVPEVRVTIPQTLRSFCSGPAPSRCGEFCIAARNVRELLAELAQRHPQVHVRICDEQGQPRPHINVFINNDHIRARGGLESSLIAGDRVTILPAVSGG